jgi:hypothetical protein
MMAEAMEVDGATPLPLSNRAGSADVDVPLDRVSVMECHLIPVKIDDIQVASPDLPRDVISRLIGGHHLVEILLVRSLLLGGSHPHLVRRSAVVSDRRCHDNLVGKTGGSVNDLAETLAGPPDGGHRLELGQLSLILVDRIGDKVPQRGDYNSVDLREVPLVPNQVLHPVRQLGKSPVGDRESVVVPVHHRLRRHEFLDVPVRKQNDRRGVAVGRPLPRLLSFGRPNVCQVPQREATLSLIGESVDGRPVLLLERRNLRLEFCDLDFRQDALDRRLHFVSHARTPCIPEVFQP